MPTATRCWRPASRARRCRSPRAGCGSRIASSIRTLSLPYRPYHKHQRRLYLTPGEIVRVEVEIWPTSMVFRKGHRIRLDVQPRDGVGSASYMHYHADYNTGTNTVYAGGDKESYLSAAGHSDQG